MTKEELIDFIKFFKGHWTFTTESGKEVSEEQVIKALEQEPVCEDCISRERMLKYFDGWKNQIKYYHPYAKNFDIPYEEAVQWVKELPPVNPQKPKSEWEHDHEILKAYSDGASAVLDNVRAEISERSRMHMDGDLYIKTSDCMQIIDEFTAEEDKA